MNHNKTKFSLEVKCEVWKRDCHPSEPRICQCCTCEKIVACPFDVQRHLNIQRSKNNYKKINYGIFRNLEILFGNHIIIPGPRVIIQCPHCHNDYKNKILNESHLFKSDQFMVYLKD